MMNTQSDPYDHSIYCIIFDITLYIYFFVFLWSYHFLSFSLSLALFLVFIITFLKDYCPLALQKTIIHLYLFHFTLVVSLITAPYQQHETVSEL